jgi:RNA polymerase sigma-70 factor, ECF subfamily
VGEPAAEEDLRRLVDAALHGDRDAAGALYARFHGTVLAIELSLTRGDVALAQDLTQDTFTKALYRLDQFEWRGPASLRSWLATIARNTFRDHVRSAAERHHGGYDVPEVPADDDGPEEQVVDRDLVGVTRQATGLLERLKPEHRLVLRRTLGEGRSARDVAEELGRSEAAVHQLKRRALLAARALAERDDTNLPAGRDPP